MTSGADHPKELISALVDGELMAGQLRSVEDHLAGCGECRRLREDLRLISSATSREAVPGVPAGLRARIGWRVRSVRAGGAGRSSRPWFFRAPPLAAAGLVGAALVSVLLFPDLPDLAPPAPREQGGESPPALSDAADMKGEPMGSMKEGPQEEHADAWRDRPRQAVKNESEPGGLPPATAHEESATAVEPLAPVPAPSEPQRRAGGDRPVGDTAALEKRTAAPPSPEQAAAPSARAALSIAEDAMVVRAAECRAVWDPTGGRVHRISVADPDAFASSVSERAAGYGGRAERARQEEHLWRVLVPSGRWAEMARLLRAGEAPAGAVAEAGSEALPETVPPDTDCVGLSVLLSPAQPESR